MQTWLAERLGEKNFYLAVTAVVVIGYLSLALASAMAKAPWWNEAWFASPALNLVTTGSMGTSVLDPSEWLKGVDQYTYWIMPLYPLAQACWFKLLGFGLLPMRALSAAWGLVALASWFLILKSLSGDKKVALLGLVVLALDYDFVTMASEGRMDMMSATLGFAAFAAYLWLRERHFTLAVLAGHTLVAASAFTHPNGYLAFAGLSFLTLYFDRARFRWSHLAMAAVPYLVGATGWGLYILQSPSLFYSQFSGNSSGRLAGLSSPLAALKNEVVRRYLRFYAFPPDHTGSGHGIWGGIDHGFKVFALAGYAAALIAAFLTRSIRRHPGYRALLILTAIYVLSLTLLDGRKRYYYLIYVFPMYAAVLAVWARWLWQSRVVPAWAIALGLASLIALNVGGIVDRIRLNTYRHSYLPAVSYLKDHAGEKSLIMGSAELGFELGFVNHLVDDHTLGYYSGKRPDLVVLGPRYKRDIELYQVEDPQVYRHIASLLAREFELVYDRQDYTIYARHQMVNPSGGPPTGQVAHAAPVSGQKD